MAMANMTLIGVFVTKLWPVQALACGGGATKNIISPKFSNFGDIIRKYFLQGVRTIFNNNFRFSTAWSNCLFDCNNAITAFVGYYW